MNTVSRYIKMTMNHAKTLLRTPPSSKLLNYIQCVHISKIEPFTRKRSITIFKSSLSNLKKVPTYRSKFIKIPEIIGISLFSFYIKYTLNVCRMLHYKANVHKKITQKIGKKYFYKKSSKYFQCIHRYIEKHT